MTNNAIPNVPRELLERVLYLMDNYIGTTHTEEDELRALLSAPSPAGVDGCKGKNCGVTDGVSHSDECFAEHERAYSCAGVDGLEVVGWYRMDDRKAITPYPSVCATWHKMGAKVGAAYSDSAQAIIDGLRGENERIRLNIAEYNEAIACYQSERDQLAQRIGEMEGLLRDSAELIKHGVFEDGICCCGSSVDSHGFGDGHSPVDALAYHAGQVCERIDAALSAGKEGE